VVFIEKGGKDMHALQIDDLELVEAWSENDPTRHARFDFPIFNLTGALAASVVYFEVDPGNHLGMHTDSAEEILYIVSGTAEAIVGDERGVVGPGSLALVPAMVPHDVVNNGEETVRIVGFFASSTVVSVFEDPFAPIGRRVVGTPLPEESEVLAAAS
jgi:quercetin dioxygenase-like cupin family protein